MQTSIPSTADYVLAWTSGHTPPKVLYFLEEEGRRWCCTEQREQATRFSTKKKAIDTWLSKHTWPEDYQYAIDNGQVRAEHYKTPRLWV